MIWDSNAVEILIDILIFCSTCFFYWKLNLYNPNENSGPKLLRAFCWLSLIILIKDIFELFIPGIQLSIAIDILVLFVFSMWQQQNMPSRKGTWITLIISYFLLGIFNYTNVIDDYIGRNIFRSTPVFIMYLWFVITLVKTNANHSKLPTPPLMPLFFTLTFFIVLRSTARTLYPEMELISLMFYWISVVYIAFKHENHENRPSSSQLNMLNREIQGIFDFLKKVREISSSDIDEETMDNLMLRFTEISMQGIKADAGAVYMVDKLNKTLIPKIICGTWAAPFEVPEMVSSNEKSYTEYLRNRSIKIGETVLGESILKGQSLLITDVSSAKHLHYNHAEGLQYASSLIAVPLVAGEELLGIISLVSKKPDMLFTENDLSFLSAISNYVSQTVENFYAFSELFAKKQIDREIEIAQEIQKSFLPKILPSFIGLTVSTYKSTHRGVGGDYFNCLTTKDKKIALSICDIAGKNITATTIMVQIHTILLMLMKMGVKPETTLSIINQILCQKKDVDRYATIELAIFDPVKKSLLFSNAAHHPLILLQSESGEIIHIDTPGLPAGIDFKMNYEQKEVQLSTGDVLAMYTDGLTEAANPKRELYGLERLKKILIQNKSSSVESIKDALITDVKEFTAGTIQQDDMSFLIFKID